MDLLIIPIKGPWSNPQYNILQSKAVVAIAQRVFKNMPAVLGWLVVGGTASRLQNRQKTWGVFVQLLSVGECSIDGSSNSTKYGVHTKIENKQSTFQIVSEVQDPPIGSYWGIPFGKLSIPNPIRRTSQCMKDIDPTRSGQNLPCIPLYSANMFVILCVSWTILQIHRQNLCVCVCLHARSSTLLYIPISMITLQTTYSAIITGKHTHTHTHTTIAAPRLHQENSQTRTTWSQVGSSTRSATRCS